MDNVKLIEELKKARVALMLEKLDIDKQIESLDHAIAGLSSINHNISETVITNEHEAHTESVLLPLIEKQTEAITLLIEKIEALTTNKETKPIEASVVASEDYPKNGTIAKKIVYALVHIGPSTAKTIANYIVACEPGLSLTKVHNTVTMMAWTLAKEGEIYSEKEGNKNIYSVKSKKKQTPMRSVI